MSSFVAQRGKSDSGDHNPCLFFRRSRDTQSQNPVLDFRVTHLSFSVRGCLLLSEQAPHSLVRRARGKYKDILFLPQL